MFVLLLLELCMNVNYSRSVISEHPMRVIKSMNLHCMRYIFNIYNFLSRNNFQLKS